MFLALVMRSFQVGSYDHMINNAVESYTGYIQIQDAEYWDDKTIDKTFEINEDLMTEIQQNSNVKQISPRLESFALASSGIKTKGVLVLGIDPEKEFSQVESKLVKWRFSDEAIARLEKENLPEIILKKIMELKNESYSYPGKIELDLELSNNLDKINIKDIAKEYFREDLKSDSIRQIKNRYNKKFEELAKKHNYLYNKKSWIYKKK